MPTYEYICEAGHTVEIVEPMDYGVERICLVCQDPMWRKPSMPAVNWNGLRPSAEPQRSPAIQDMINNEDRNRDRYIEKKEKRK